MVKLRRMKRLLIPIGVVIILVFGIVLTIYAWSYKPPVTPTVCMNIHGGIGNMMFQIASAYGLASDRNMNLAITRNNSSLELVKTFDIDKKLKGFRWCSVSEPETVVITERLASGYDAELAVFTPSKQVVLKEYLQSWQYFDKWESEIKTMFKFNDKLIYAAKKLLNSLLSTYKARQNLPHVVKIGLHIRRGDMMDTNNQRYGYRIPEFDYIRRAMNWMRNKYGRVLFLVVSNDNYYVEEYVTDSDSIYVDGGTRSLDLALLSLCDHVVMTVGSFGWWGSYLSGGDGIYFKYPVHKRSELSKHYSPYQSDYFLPRWIPMS